MNRIIIEGRTIRILSACLLTCLAAMPACYFDWDDLEYVPPCDPLDPAATCSSRQKRCVPRGADDPVCEGPVGNPNQDGYCRDNSDCGSIEVCLKPHELVLSKICMTLCRRDADCPDGYSCVCSFDMAIRGEAWGGCLMNPPTEWICDDIRYAGRVSGQDTNCDCGCGVFDPDCPDDDTKRCTACEPKSKALCIPPGWDCSDTKWEDGKCDCGCGVIDAKDCENAMRESCDNCPFGSCGLEFPDECRNYDPIQPENNALCKDPPQGWICDLKSYFDGTRCDCGCGVKDPDCESSMNTDCEACPEESCGYDAGCDISLFVKTDNAVCVWRSE